MRISDWSSDVCSSDLQHARQLQPPLPAHADLRQQQVARVAVVEVVVDFDVGLRPGQREAVRRPAQRAAAHRDDVAVAKALQHLGGEHRAPAALRSEEHTSELQSLMRISYAVFCLKKKKA